MKDEALKLAQEPYAPVTSLQARALDKMAENARELGLDYEPAPVQEPVAWCIEYEVLISRTNIGSSLRKFKEHWAKCSFVSEDKNAEIEIENWRNRVEKPLIFADTTPPAQPEAVQEEDLYDLAVKADNGGQP